MTVRYHYRDTRPIPDYVCQKNGIEHGQPVCQTINGEQIDKAIGELLVQTMTPMALDIALAVQQEVHSRIDEVDRLRLRQVERARYEADLAQRRYMHVDPANRLVADALEAEWNGKLRVLNETQEEYERLRRRDNLNTGDAQHARIMALAGDFPRLWQDPQTPDREKKRMIRLMLEDVTLIKRDEIIVHVRFRGGAVQSFSRPLPLSAPFLRKTPAEVVGEVDRLLERHTETEIAAILNEKGLRSGTGQAFTPMTVLNIRRNYGLQDRYQRLRTTGLLTVEELASRLSLAPSVVKDWRDRGLLKAHRYNDKGQCLYEPPPENLPGKFKRKQSWLVANGTSPGSVKGVQYEA
jgi:hypothetical protein